jgi:FMN phosphatase YigB (HAD superfamily)
MKDIKTFFFLVGGILLPEIYNATIRMVDNKSLPLADKDRIEFNNFGKNLCAGIISGGEYLGRLSSYYGLHAPISENDLFDQVKLNPDALVLAGDLADRGNEVILFSDYPKNWLSMFDEAGILTERFSRVMYSHDMEYTNMPTNMFDQLMEQQVLKPSQCMWVDSNPARTCQAIRRGIDAIIYVDERRTRRELKLRSLI